MFPVLRLGPIAVQTPGLILILGYWLAHEWTAKRSSSTGFSGKAISNAWIFSTMAAIVAARLGYAATNWSVFRDAWTGIFALNPQALDLTIGFIFWVGVHTLVLARHRVNLVSYLDALSPSLTLLLAAIALANLAGGSAHGITSTVPWALDVNGEFRHPLQAYYILAYTVIAILALLIERNSRVGNIGSIALLTAVLIAFSSIMLQPLHTNSVLLPGGYRLTQVLGLAVLMLGLEYAMNRTAINTRQ